MDGLEYLNKLLKIAEERVWGLKRHIEFTIKLNKDIEQIEKDHTKEVEKLIKR